MNFLGARWNTEETHELIAAYKERLLELHVFTSDEKKNRIWEAIVADVNSVRRRKINERQAEAKIALLRSLYEKRDEKALAPLYTEVKEMVEAEEHTMIGNQPSATSAFSHVHKLPSRKRIRMSPSPDDPQEFTKLPAWFVAYSKDAQRRHEEKLRIQQSIVDVLETILVQ